MNVLPDLPPARAGQKTSSPSADLLLTHPVFCQFALPFRAQAKGVWRRAFDDASVTIEAGGDLPLPAGRYLRLLLIDIFDTALRTDSHQVELGADAAALAARLGIEARAAKLRELADQVARLAAARLTITSDGGAPLSVFDARGRQRATAASWRPTIRLNARFFSSLGDGAVALERGVVAALADAPAALDLHAWLAWALPGAHPDGEITATWDELRQRFGAPGQSVAELRAGFTESLSLLQRAAPHVSGIITDDGITFRHVAAPAIEPAGGVSGTAPPTRLNDAADLPPPPEDGPAPSLRAQEEPSRPPADAPAPEAPRRPPDAAEAAPPSSAPPAGRGEGPSPRPIRQTISLRSHLTGLPQVVWLQRANGRDIIVFEVTPGGRYDPDSVTVIALEPVTLQVSGGLFTRDFERVAAWATANRDLIEDWWDGRVEAFDDVVGRVRKVPAPTWR